ncbi:MAG: helix-turn-helix domain-containing protein, partial [Halanaerobiales bacterium]
MNAKNKAVKRNQSVDKVFKIVETMANYGEPMRLHKISELSGIPSSTILRFLKTLIINGYAYQNSDDSKYSLTLKFSHLGSLVNEQYSIRDIARPFLKKLSKLCQEST